MLLFSYVTLQVKFYLPVSSCCRSTSSIFAVAASIALFISRTLMALILCLFPSSSFKKPASKSFKASWRLWWYWSSSSATSPGSRFAGVNSGWLGPTVGNKTWILIKGKGSYKDNCVLTIIWKCCKFLLTHFQKLGLSDVVACLERVGGGWTRERRAWSGRRVSSERWDGGPFADWKNGMVEGWGGSRLKRC